VRVVNVCVVLYNFKIKVSTIRVSSSCCRFCLGSRQSLGPPLVPSVYSDVDVLVVDPNFDVDDMSCRAASAVMPSVLSCLVISEASDYQRATTNAASC
jgi:hypothetical protein